MNQLSYLIKKFFIPYTDLRVNNLHLPDNIYRYELRHDDKCQDNLCEIAPRILINFQGTILSDKKINLGKQGYRLIDEDKDIQHLGKDNMTVNDIYINKKYTTNGKIISIYPLVY